MKQPGEQLHKKVSPKLQSPIGNVNFSRLDVPIEIRPDELSESLGDEALEMTIAVDTGTPADAVSGHGKVVFT